MVQGDYLIKTYMEYIQQISDASIDFAEGAGLAMISGIAQRQVIIQTLGSKRMYPNIWVMLLGASGISRKSTTIRPARKTIGHVYPEILMPDKMTEESTFAYFHTKGDAKTMLIADEFAGTLANLDKQYAMGYKQLLMKMYDCIDYERRVLKSSDEILQNTYLSILAGGTPFGVMKYLSEKDIESGFLPRFLIIYPPLPDPKPIHRKTPKADTLFKQISAEAFLLRALLDQVEIHSVYDTTAFTKISDYFYNKELKVRKNYTQTLGSVFAREMEYAFKISTLLALDELIEQVGNVHLNNVNREIRYSNGLYKTKDDEEDAEGKDTHKNVYQYFMPFIDIGKTSEKLSVAYVELLRAFGDAFGGNFNKKEYDTFYILYNYIKKTSNPLTAYESGILASYRGVKVPLRVTDEHVQKALDFIERREADAIKLYSMIIGGRSRQLADKVFDYIEKKGTVAHSVVLRNLNMNKNDLREAVQQLVEEDRIEIKMIGRKKVYVVKTV